MFLLVSFQVTKDLQRSSTPKKSPKQSVCLASLRLKVQPLSTNSKSSCKTSPFFPTQDNPWARQHAMAGISRPFFFSSVRSRQLLSTSQVIRSALEPISNARRAISAFTGFFFRLFFPGFCRLQKSSFFKKQIILLKKKKHDQNWKIWVFFVMFHDVSWFFNPENHSPLSLYLFNFASCSFSANKML